MEDHDALMNAPRAAPEVEVVIRENRAMIGALTARFQRIPGCTTQVIDDLYRIKDTVGVVLCGLGVLPEDWTLPSMEDPWPCIKARAEAIQKEVEQGVGGEVCAMRSRMYLVEGAVVRIDTWLESPFEAPIE